MDTILIERDAARRGLTTVRLNRPDKLNAINAAMHAELQEAFRDLRQDFETRVVILTGSERAFTAGADQAEATASARTVLEQRHRLGAGNRTCALLESLDQVTICAINGLCIGGGVAIAACADLRLAAESAWFSIPEVDLDIPLTWNALPRLMRELGPARTRELVMTCDRFSAQDALQWGFVNRVYADGELLPQALALAEKLLAKDPLALATTKSATAALAQLMVPEQATYSDREQLMLWREMARRKRATGDGNE